jgi:hypothetical protein
VQRLSRAHAALVDVLISEPWLSQRELAARFGYSESWISQILRSGAVRSYSAARRVELVDPVLRAAVEKNLAGGRRG